MLSYLYLLAFNFLFNTLAKLVLGYAGGNDWYRSLTCASLVARGAYGLWTGNLVEHLYITCVMFETYVLVDLYNMWLKNFPRPELLFHHLFCGSAYLAMRTVLTHPSDICITNLFLLAESLSVMNAYLREKPNVLFFYRLVVVLTIRTPIWVYYNWYTWYHGFVCEHFITSMNNIGTVFMPILDVVLMWSMVRKLSLKNKKEK